MHIPLKIVRFFCFSPKRFSANALYLENREIHRTVGAVVDKALKCGEIVGLRMFDDYQCAFFDECRLENQCGNFGETGMVVGRVGKNEIHCRRGVFDEAEYVAFDNPMSFATKDTRHFSDKRQLCLCHFHRCHRCAATRK